MYAIVWDNHISHAIRKSSINTELVRMQILRSSSLPHVHNVILIMNECIFHVANMIGYLDTYEMH